MTEKYHDVRATTDLTKIICRQRLSPNTPFAPNPTFCAFTLRDRTSEFTSTYSVDAFTYGAQESYNKNTNWHLNGDHCTKMQHLNTHMI